MVVQGNGFHGLVLHIHVPDFHCKVVARHKEASVFRVTTKREEKENQRENRVSTYFEYKNSRILQVQGRETEISCKKKRKQKHYTYVTSEIELRMSAMKDLLPLAPSRWVSW